MSRRISNITRATLWQAQHAELVVVAIPCCVEQLLAPAGAEPLPVSEFTDMGVHSQDRVVRLWHLPALVPNSGVAGEEGASPVPCVIRPVTHNHLNAVVKLQSNHDVETQGHADTPGSTLALPPPPVGAVS